MAYQHLVIFGCEVQLLNLQIQVLHQVLVFHILGHCNKYHNLILADNFFPVLFVLKLRLGLILLNYSLLLQRNIVRNTANFFIVNRINEVYKTTKGYRKINWFFCQEIRRISTEKSILICGLSFIKCLCPNYIFIFTKTALPVPFAWGKCEGFSSLICHQISSYYKEGIESFGDIFIINKVPI